MKSCRNVPHLSWKSPTNYFFQSVGSWWRIRHSVSFEFWWIRQSYSTHRENCVKVKGMFLWKIDTVVLFLFFHKNKSFLCYLLLLRPVISIYISLPISFSHLFSLYLYMHIYMYIYFFSLYLSILISLNHSIILSFGVYLPFSSLPFSVISILLHHYLSVPPYLWQSKWSFGRRAHHCWTPCHDQPVPA